MRSYLQVLGLSLFLLSGESFADHIHGRVDLMSDYVFRGVSRTDHGPAFQGALSYELPFDFDLGVKILNVGADDARGMEMQAYVNYTLKIKDFQAKTQYEFFRNPYSTDAQTHFFEASAAYKKLVGVGVSYANRYLGTRSTSLYTYAHLQVPVLAKEGFFAKLHGGYSKFSDETHANNSSYWDYKISLHKNYEDHDFSLFYVGTNRELMDAFGAKTPAKDDGYGAAYSYEI